MDDRNETLMRGLLCREGKRREESACLTEKVLGSFRSASESGDLVFTAVSLFVIFFPGLSEVGAPH